MQRHDVQEHQHHQNQRHGDHVEGEEAVERGIGHHEIAANPFRQGRADPGNGVEQRDDDLRAPVGHVAPGQQVAHEGLGHQRDENHHADQPQQFARTAVGTVQQATVHVQVHDDEERRGTGGVDVADQPAPGHITHDVLDRGECDRHAGGIERRIGLVMHGEEDAGDDLDDQHQQGEGTEEIPEIEVPRRIVFRQMLPPHLGERETVVDPGEQVAHAAAPFLSLGSMPIMMLLASL